MRKKRLKKVKHHKNYGNVLLILAGLSIVSSLFFANFSISVKKKEVKKAYGNTAGYSKASFQDLFGNPYNVTPTASPTAAVKPSPTEQPPSGFCLNVPVLMYHHVEPYELAKKEGHAQLTVDSAIFDAQMKYLVDHGYNTISAEELAQALISHTALPSKTVVVTLDDGYMDNYLYAYDSAKRYNVKLNVMIPTGLLGNSGYMSWENLKEMVNSGLVYAYDHTWSHYSIPKGPYEKVEQEIMMAKKQLEEQLGKPVVIFTYPYGPSSPEAIEILKKNGFLAAFTTVQSNIQCDSYIYTLKRTRVGNASLSSYGI